MPSGGVGHPTPHAKARDWLNVLSKKKRYPDSARGAKQCGKSKGRRATGAQNERLQPGQPGPPCPSVEPGRGAWVPGNPPLCCTVWIPVTAFASTQSGETHAAKPCGNGTAGRAGGCSALDVQRGATARIPSVSHTCCVTIGPPRWAGRREDLAILADGAVEKPSQVPGGSACGF